LNVNGRSANGNGWSDNTNANGNGNANRNANATANATEQRTVNAATNATVNAATNGAALTQFRNETCKTALVTWVVSPSGRTSVSLMIVVIVVSAAPSVWCGSFISRSRVHVFAVAFCQCRRCCCRVAWTRTFPRTHGRRRAPHRRRRIICQCPDLGPK
jgi:hypothetical protein